MKTMFNEGSMMTEPVSASAAGASLGVKLASLLGLTAAGVVGALVIAWFDPPKDRRMLFAQVAVAAISSLVFGPAAFVTLDHYLPFFDRASAPVEEVLSWAAPVFFLVGALSWGAFASLAKLRELIRQNGASMLWGWLPKSPPKSTDVPDLPPGQ